MKRIAIILTSALMGISAAGQAMLKSQPRHAVVELSSIYMRIAPDYESALETQELMGTIVEITGEDRYWREIVSPQPYRAWCTEKGIVEMTSEELKAYADAPKCIFTELYGHIYEKPSCKSGTLCDLVGGDVMRIAGQAGNDEKKAGNDGNDGSNDGRNDGKKAGNEGKKGGKDCMKTGRKWTEVMTPSGRRGWVLTKDVKPHEGFRSIAKGEGNAGSVSDAQMEDIIATAFRLKGVPYLWGGMTPKGVDCSGLVRWSYLMNGILLPRNASQMVHCGDEVRLDELERGDLVFFGSPATDKKPRRITHVGIYIGNGRIIHSSHLVRVNSLNKADKDYYENAHRLIAARRL